MLTDDIIRFPMDPVLLNLGPFEIRYYGLFMALAFLAGYFIFRSIARKQGIDDRLTDEYFVYIFLGIILGARLLHVFVYEPGYYLEDPVRMLYIWQGGLASHGGFIGGIFATWLFCRKHGIRFYKIADIVVIPAALGSVFIRLGNFTNSEIVGRQATVPWAMEFEGYEGLRHPSQLYEAFMNLAVFMIMLVIRKARKLPEGLVFWSFVMIYSFLRFFVEFFKEFQGIAPSWILTEGQWLCMAFFAVSAYFMLADKGRKDFLAKVYKSKSDN